MTNETQIIMDSWKEIQMLQNIASVRSERAIEPFLLEEFCIECASAFAKCPVYPWGGAERPGDVCKYLTTEKFPNYRCPLAYPEGIIEVISTNGTPLQKNALERYADMSVRYGVNPIDENFLQNNRSTCLNRAIRIYDSLGLAEKAKATEVLGVSVLGWTQQRIRR
jgi:hypothetical protein